jgi:hypothetical protein
MRVTYRTGGVKDYWSARWADIPADNAMENLNAYPLKYAELTVKGKNGESSKKAFHKMNLTRSEYEQLFIRSGFTIDKVYPVENMPILYKFAFFRSSGHKEFDENKARKEGYCLSWFGQMTQDFLMRFFPDQFCNIYVVIARKK